MLAAAPPDAATRSYHYAYVGSYTPNGGGIYLFRLDPATAAMTQLQVIDDIRNPSWLAVNPAQTRLYAVSEIDNYQGARSGAIVSYAIDDGSLQIRRIGAVSSGGTAPAHVSVHPSGKFVFAANYGGGSAAVFPVGPDGALLRCNGRAAERRPEASWARRERSTGAIRAQRPRWAASAHGGGRSRRAIRHRQ